MSASATQGGHKKYGILSAAVLGGLSHYAKKINKRMWAWQAWHWATPLHIRQ